MIGEQDISPSPDRASSFEFKSSKCQDSTTHDKYHPRKKESKEKCGGWIRTWIGWIYHSNNRSQTRTAKEEAKMQLHWLPVLLCLLTWSSQHVKAEQSGDWSHSCNNNEINVKFGERLNLVSPVHKLKRCHFVSTDEKTTLSLEATVPEGEETNRRQTKTWHTAPVGWNLSNSAQSCNLTIWYHNIQLLTFLYYSSAS